ncbi:kinase-like protein [Calocera cornea HHB12733]|uniref:Kinase-like protein n=1 Tax=Calocera cornea HHB12733 TaxID=1353952 RepID=A0A165EIA3_9BASI|nr:kinase-like protein [Calocera cornea HHB12733]
MTTITERALSSAPLHQSNANDILQEVSSLVPDLTPTIANIVQHPLASGVHGDIWRGSLLGKPVALKTMARFFSYVEAKKRRNKMERLMNELTTWVQMRHPNLLELYGVCERGRHGVALVSPWMEHGTVRDYLKIYPEARRSPLVLDVVHALAYMHSLQPPIVHGNLLLENILVRPSGQVCVAGFAMAGFLRDPDAHLMDFDRYTGSPRFMAPELIFNNEYGKTQIGSFTPASDVYAFGMVAYVLYSDRVPFHHITNKYVVPRAVHAREQPSHPGAEAVERGLSDEMWAIMQDCWCSRPEERPSTTQLTQRIPAATTSNMHSSTMELRHKL